MKTLFRIPSNPRYLIFDWSNVVARAYAVRPDDGLLMLCTMLRSYRKRFSGWNFVFCLEGEGVSQRRKIFADYKKTREGDGPTVRHPESLLLLENITCTVVRAKIGEADDAIASFIRQEAFQRAGKILVVSEDRDLWQLIQRKVSILTRKKEVDAGVCLQVLGVPPKHVRMYKALLGDSSDHLPRVPRAKTAMLKKVAGLCRTPYDLSKLLEDDESWLSSKDRERLIRFQAQIVCNWKVIGLRSKLSLTTEAYQETAISLIDFMASQGISIDVRDAKVIAEPS